MPSREALAARTAATKASAPRSVAAHLREVPPGVRPTLQAARRAVRSVAPNAVEVAYQGVAPRSATFMWKIARYTVEGANVVGIGTYPAHSTLFFYRGRELDDGSGLLAGGGKEMRSITLRTPADVERPQVKRLLKKAFELAGGRPGSGKPAPTKRRR